MTFDPGQLSSILRQGGQFAAGGVTVLVALGSINADQAHMAVEAIQQIGDGLSQATAGFSKLMIIIGPVAAGFMGKAAWVNSSFKNKIAAVFTVAKNPDLPTSSEAKDALQAAVASRPDRMVVAIDPTKPAEAALRVASLPEVKKVITNPEIAAVTPAEPKIVAPNI